MMDYDELFDPVPEAVPIDVERLTEHWKDEEYWALRGKLRERDYRISDDRISERMDRYLDQRRYGKLEELDMLSDRDILEEEKIEDFYGELLEEQEYDELIKFYEMTGNAPELEDELIEESIEEMIESEEFDKLGRFLDIYGEESLSSGKIFDSYQEMILSGEPVKAFSLSDHVPYDVPERLVDVGFKKYALEGRKDLVEELRDVSMKEVSPEVERLLSLMEDSEGVPYIGENDDGKDV